VFTLVFLVGAVRWVQRRRARRLVEIDLADDSHDDAATVRLPRPTALNT